MLTDRVTKLQRHRLLQRFPISLCELWAHTGGEIEEDRSKRVEIGGASGSPPLRSSQLRRNERIHRHGGPRVMALQLRLVFGVLDIVNFFERCD